MNSMERIGAVIKGKPTDRRAVSVTLSLYGARLTGCRAAFYYRNSRDYVQGQCAVLETFRPDVIFGPFALPLFGEAFGSTVRFNDKTAPQLGMPAVSSPDKLGMIKSPDINTHPVPLYFREIITALASNLRGEVPVAAIMLDPVSLPVMIMGLEGWLETLLFDPAGAKTLMELTAGFFVELADALLDDGAAFIVLPAVVASPAFLTEEILTKSCIPILKEAFSKVDGSFFIHSTGTALNPFLGHFKTLPNIAGFVLDSKDDITAARAVIGPEMIIAGNIDGPTLSMSSAEEIYQKCESIIRDRRGDNRFVLGTSAADVPPETPPENIHAMVRAAESFRGGS